MIKINKNIIVLGIIILSLFSISKPIETRADFDFGRLIDPACFFACKDDKNTNTTVYVNGGYHSDPIYPNYTYPVNQTVTSPLGVSCYSTPTSGGIGENISWRASAFGGNGSYYITWSGSDGLSGYGSSLNKIYSSSGSKYASVTVSSGNQNISKNCSNNVQITDYNNYNNNYNDNYYNNNYNNNYNNYSPLYVSCSADTTYSSVDSNVIWRANAYGGNGYYSYSWSGSEYLTGSGRTVNINYRSIGTKTASVTVYSGNQSTTQYCSNNVTVGQINNQYYYPNNYNPVIYYPNSYTNNIQVACYPDRTSAKVGDSVNWSVEATGSTGNFTYNWSGSEGLISNQASVNKVYGTTGVKNATVLVTSSNGQSLSQACGSTVNIKSTNKATTKAKVVTNTKTDTTDSGIVNSVLSLKNVPWILVALLVLFIIMFTIIYLFLNRNKI